MNDDLVVQKILKLLENNTAFIGYALNGGIGTKINVRNTETGKTIQALSINVASTGEVLVVKDSEDGQYKAVTFKTAEKVSERIIQLRKTKPIDDKKVIKYTDSDIEVFYLFVKLIDTGSPVPTQLQSTWIRKGSSCTQFVGAYERCNYASKATIGGVSYTGLPYVPYTSLQNCLNDDLGRDARTPHGTSDENGPNPGWKMYSTQVTGFNEQLMLEALTSHDETFGSNFRRIFGYGSILDCSGSMYLAGWNFTTKPQTGEPYTHCEFGYLPGFSLDCTPEMEALGYCDRRGFINSKTPPPGSPGVGSIDNSWAYQYDWINLPYSFMYKRHFPPLYQNGDNAKGSFLILEVNQDQSPTIPQDHFPWVPGCPSNSQGGTYDGSGGNRFPDGIPPTKKRDMKLSTHKAEIWLGSSKKKEAIKLYELGASDLFSGMYNSFIIKANETIVDKESKLQIGVAITQEQQFQHEKFYENWNKNIIDLNIDPRVWVYIIDNKPSAESQANWHDLINPQNQSLQTFIDNLYNRTINLSIVSKTEQVIHLKLGLIPKNPLSNNDCKGNILNSQPQKGNDNFNSQSWEYQKFVTIRVKNWKIESTTNTLDTTLLESNSWNKNYIERKYFTSFGTFNGSLARDSAPKILLRENANTDLTELVSGNHYEQYNYGLSKLIPFVTDAPLFVSFEYIKKNITSNDLSRRVGWGTESWWELWDKTYYDNRTKRLSSVVGYDKNYYQIVRSSKLNPTLDYGTGATFSRAVSVDSYYDFLPTRPLQYFLSTIKRLRDKLIPSSLVPTLSSRKDTLDKLGLLFYFSSFASSWTREFAPPTAILLPSTYYNTSATSYLRSRNYIDNNPVLLNNIQRRLQTIRWFNYLWTQLVFDEFIKIDIDSYKKVDFTLPTNPSQYIKYAFTSSAINTEYPFTTQVSTISDLKTILSPGVLDITKQVPIKKPTNVDLDPNMSFLLYLYPYVSVTKKTKTI